MPAASLLNLVDVELIYEGVKYVLQVRAGPCSSQTGRSASHGDRDVRSCPEGERCNTRLSFKNVQCKNEVNNLILTRQPFLYILLP